MRSQGLPVPDMAGSSEPVSLVAPLKIFKKGEKMLAGKRRREQRLRNSRGNDRGKTNVRRNRKCSVLEQVSTAACGAPVPEQADVPEGTMAHEDPTLEQRKRDGNSIGGKTLCADHNHHGLTPCCAP